MLHIYYFCLGITVSGSELPQAVLDYIRNNDKAINEGCDKVIQYMYLLIKGDYTNSNVLLYSS